MVETTLLIYSFDTATFTESKPVDKLTLRLLLEKKTSEGVLP